MVEHRKTKSTQPNCPTRCPTLYLILETWPEAPFIAEFLLENISEMIAEQELEEAVIDLWAHACGRGLRYNARSQTSNDPIYAPIGYFAFATKWAHWQFGMHVWMTLQSSDSAKAAPHTTTTNEDTKRWKESGRAQPAHSAPWKGRKRIRPEMSVIENEPVRHWKD